MSECYSCGYPAKDLKAYPAEPVHSLPERALCEVCAGTLIGRATGTPRLYPDTDQVAVKAIAWGINRVLDEVRGRKPGEGR